jgi:hypothetical protein
MSHTYGLQMLRACGSLNERVLCGPKGQNKDRCVECPFSEIYQKVHRLIYAIRELHNCIEALQSKVKVCSDKADSEGRN